MDWITQNWVELVAALYAFECVLAFVSRFTPWKWDDNMAGWLGTILNKFFPKGK